MIFLENKLRGILSGPQLLLVEEGVGLFSTVLHYEDGTENNLPATTPAKDLIAATEIDYRGYRREIKRLQEEHPLFQVRLDVSVADFEDLVTEALLLPSMLQKIDPVSFFVLGELLHQSLQAEDDGSASFLLELALYFQQDKQRIARCDYCWGWFVPKTKKITRYCDRVTDGFRCKQRGSRFKRNLIEEQDSALRICNQLRDRMYARFLRWQDAAPSERSRLISMEDDQYIAWSENARLARMEYLDGKLTAEEFLRRIDMAHELNSYEADKAELVEETAWQNRVASDFRFDSETYYPEAMQVLDLGAVEPKWELRTAEDLRKEDQKGHQSLREKYGGRRVKPFASRSEYRQQKNQNNKAVT